jgi:hypothetical protein
VKTLFSFSALFLVLVLASSGAMITASTNGAQAQAKVTVKPLDHAARVGMCNTKLKGLYNFEGRQSAHGFCLQNIMHSRWQ